MADGFTITVKLNDESFVLHWNDLTAVDIGDLRKQAGISVMKLFAQMEERDFDLDGFAALLFLARRQNGERKVTYTEIAENLSFGDDFSLDFELPEGKDLPE